MEQMPGMNMNEVIVETPEPSPEVVENTIEDGAEGVEKAQAAVAEMLIPEGASPEERQSFMERLKQEWEKTEKTYVMGMPIPDLLLGLGTGAAASFVLKGAVTSAFGMGSAAMMAGANVPTALAAAGMGMLTGAGAGVARTMGMAGFHELQFRSAERAAQEDPGKLLEMVKSDKMKKIDALMVITDMKRSVDQFGTPEGYDTIVSIEQKLIEHNEQLEGLEGFDRLQEYVKLAESVRSEKDVARRAEIAEEIARSTGRHIDWGRVGESALIGALGGLVGTYLLGAVGFEQAHHNPLHHLPSIVEHANDEAATELSSHLTKTTHEVGRAVTGQVAGRLHSVGDASSPLFGWLLGRSAS